MATILFTWELGAGLGHMLPMRPLAAGLARAGHRVVAALRNLTSAAPVFDNAGVRLLQAPHKAGGRAYFRRTLNLAQIMANVGWGRTAELLGLASGWRNLFELVRPDLIVFDYSPTAMLASRGLPGVKRATMGNGFFCPPDGDPMPMFQMARHADGARRAEREARLRREEQTMLSFANRVLARWGAPPLERIGQMYAEVDETFLATFPELDHYGQRPGARYWGPVTRHSGGKRVVWPEAAGGSTKRVYAYLKDSPLVPDLLAALARRGCSTVVYSDGVSDDTRRKFEGPTLRFEDERLDLAQAGRESDVVVHNANGGTTAELLLAGRPALLLPLVLEQTLTARAVERLGAGETVTAAEGKADPATVERKLDALLSETRYRDAAGRFAARYADFDYEAQRREMLRRAEELLAAPRRTTTRATSRPPVEVRQTPLTGLTQVTVPLSRRPTLTDVSKSGSGPGTMGLFRG